MDSRTDAGSINEEVKETHRQRQEDAARWEVRQTLLESEIVGLKVVLFNMKSTAKKETEVLARKMRTADALIGYLKSKAKMMSISRYAYASCGIKQQEGVGLIDKRGIPLAEWTNPANMQQFVIGNKNGQDNSSDSGCKGERIDSVGNLEESERVEVMAMAVLEISEVMEFLLKRALIAETEMSLQVEKCCTSQEEVVRKTVQIKGLWARVEEMERVAMGTSEVLKEMQSKLEDMEEETSRQRQRAAENEKELSRVRQDFGILCCSVDNLVKARDTICCMEKRIHEVENISERLTTRVINLEANMWQKQAEVKKLLVENDILRGALDLKEAELAAAGEQIRLLIEKSQFPGSGTYTDF